MGKKQFPKTIYADVYRPLFHRRYRRDRAHKVEIGKRLAVQAADRLSYFDEGLIERTNEIEIGVYELKKVVKVKAKFVRIVDGKPQEGK